MMQYSTEELKTQALDAIRNKHLYFLEDVHVELGISPQTFYNHGLDKMEEIKDALQAEKVKVKKNLRNRWFMGENPTTQLVLYKLICSKDELDRLNTVRNELGGLKGEQINIVIGDDKPNDKEPESGIQRPDADTTPSV